MKNRRNWRLRSKSFVATLAMVGILSTALLLASSNSAQTNSDKYSALLKQHERVPGEVVVRARPGKALGFENSIKELGVSVASLRPFETNGEFYTVKISDDKQMAKFLETANRNPNIAYAEPNYIYHIDTVGTAQDVSPNDPQFAQLWGMQNSGQADSAGQTGTAGADIGATKAWAQTTGNRDIIVAIIDTGVDYTHPELAANIYHNPNEIPGNGIDDDGNGFIDDTNGWNFAGVSTNNPMDDHMHGTHVAGTIGAVGNNGDGVAGVAWNVRILPVKFLNAQGSGSLDDAVKAIQYATLMGANIMSNSWGGGGFSQALMDAITAAKNKGILFIAAAGNDGSSSDSTPHYPASYAVDNIISVAATDNRDQLASFSNFGKHSVHIAAPGVNILSTFPGNKYGTLSGTSMATPHVSGATALVWGAFPGEDYHAIKDRIVNSRDPKANLMRSVMSSGRLNVYNALNGIYLPSNEPQESDWIDGPPISPVESAHPYLDNTAQEWVIHGPANAKYTRVHFAKFDLEPGYDFVHLTGADGVEGDVVTGLSNAPTTTWFVNGGDVHVKLTSDSSVTKWGFQIDKIQYIPQ